MRGREIIPIHITATYGSRESIEMDSPNLGLRARGKVVDATSTLRGPQNPNEVLRITLTQGGREIKIALEPKISHHTEWKEVSAYGAISRQDRGPTYHDLHVVMSPAIPDAGDNTYQMPSRGWLVDWRYQRRYNNYVRRILKQARTTLSKMG